MFIKNHLFHHIRTKLIFSYWILFFIVISFSTGITYLYIKKAILKSVDDSLTTQIILIKNSIETSTDASIKSFFRAKAYAAYDAVSICFEKYQRGELSEIEARQLALDLLSGQKLGASGYITVMDGESNFIFHPQRELIGTNVSYIPVSQEIVSNEELFVEYEWQNPDESIPRKKSLYSKHFPPWNWYISTTGYKEELISLVNISDFEDKILAIRFGENGYPLVIDNDGTLLIHPRYKGVNMYNRDDPMGEVIREAVERKNGRVEYLWKNPDETEYREKLALFAEIPQFEMIVAVTAYKSEFMKPLNDMTRVFLITLLLSLLIIGILTRMISKSITLPILEIKEKMDLAAEGDLSVRSEIKSSDEISEIGKHFNHFISNLQKARQTLIEEERFANMGRLLSRIAHHLNTPLGTSVTAASYLKEIGLDHPEIPEETVQQIRNLAEILEKSLERTVNLISSFKMLHIDTESIVKVQTHMAHFLNTMYIKKWELKIPEGFMIAVECNEELTFPTNPELLLLVLDNLTSNSLLYSFKDRDTGKISIKVSKKDSGVEIIYSDTGEGIPLDAAERLFEPFYSSTNSYNSKGVGLSVIYNTIVTNLSGSISYEGDINTGVLYRIYLPLKPGI